MFVCEIGKSLNIREMELGVYRTGPAPKPAYDAFRWNPIRPKVRGRAEPKIGGWGIEATRSEGLASISTLESPAWGDDE